MFISFFFFLCENDLELFIKFFFFLTIGAIFMKF